MALFMALSGSLYRAASDSTRARAHSFSFFLPRSSLHDRPSSPALSRIKIQRANGRVTEARTYEFAIIARVRGLFN